MTIDRVAQLKTMHLFGMAAAWHEWQSEYSVQQKPVMPEVWLDRRSKRNKRIGKRAV